jgi:mRNA-degrading endonuclease YafQ of YafQ-DinJ toxin-antitoxin module
MFRTCDLFNETMTARSEGNPILPQKLEEFQASKIKEKTSPYGGADRPFASNGQFAGFKHAHLTHDVSVVYKMHSSNPTLIDLYGVFTHDDLGTGTPPARRTQANMLKRFNRQEFT